MAMKGGLIGIGVLLLGLAALTALILCAMFLYHIIGSWWLVLLGVQVLCYGAFKVGSFMEEEKRSERS